MIQDLASFYAACLRRAFKGWFKRADGLASTASTLVAIVLLEIHLPAQFASALPAYCALAIAAGLAISRLAIAPFELYRDERDAKLVLEKARLPKLTIGLPNPPVINSISLSGGTTESMAGTRQTIIRDWRMDVIALVCRNDSEATARGCRARLLSATRLTSDGEAGLGIVESVSLPWKKEDPEGSHIIDIAPGDTQRIWIGGVRERGHIWLFRNRDGLPIEYQQLLGEPGKYHLLIQVDGENIPAQQIRLEVEGKPGQPPESGLWRGEAAVSIIADNSPA